MRKGNCFIARASHVRIQLAQVRHGRSIWGLSRGIGRGSYSCAARGRSLPGAWVARDGIQSVRSGVRLDAVGPERQIIQLRQRPLRGRSVAGMFVSGSLGLRPLGGANIIDPRADRGASLSICTVRISALHSFRLLALPQTDFSPDHPVGMRCLADFSVGA